MSSKVEHSNDGHVAVRKFVKEWQTLCSPKAVHWCTGSDQEFNELCDLLVQQGTFVKLNSELRPNSYLARTDPRDVEVNEESIFVCSKSTTEMGPLNNWHDPTDMTAQVKTLFKDCMKGRTMYVVPFCMGPHGPYSRFGVQITDSPYVVVNLKLVSRIGSNVLNTMKPTDWFLPCIHSVGVPLHDNAKTSSWPCNPEKKLIALYEDDAKIISFGSGYGNNSFISKRLFGLRYGSLLAKKEGWIAEHCLILSLTSPEGKKYYIAAGFPTGSGKTNLATMIPTIPGWTVRCVGDDIAWMHVGEDGRLYAINPEFGFFDRVVGVNSTVSPATMATLKKNTIFTNVGLTAEGDVWWEGMTKEVPKGVVDWTGKVWDASSGTPVAHPNARYTAPASQCPVIDPEWENPNGVPLHAIMFGGRRFSTYPLVTEAFTWEHGVFLGSLVAADRSDTVTVRESHAMIPYNTASMKEYFNKWLDLRTKMGYSSPKIFFVNFFRTENGKADGKLMWPGFGDNIRLLKWICARSSKNNINTGKVHKTPLGFVPADLDTKGLNVSQDKLAALLKYDAAEWKKEVAEIEKYYQSIGAADVFKANLAELNQ